MKTEKRRFISGHSTLEYTLLLPIVFICVFICIVVFLILYQKAIIQNMAEDVTQSLSRQWGYKPLPVDEINSGVYKRETYESREVYWNLKLLFSKSKEDAAKEYIEEHIKDVGFLKPYVPKEGSGNTEPNLVVDVDVKPGLPAVLNVKIKAAYQMPMYNLFKLIGIKDCLIIEGHAQSLVYDPKEMINTTDYIYQLIRATDLYQNFIKKIEPLKKNLEKLIKE
jgi:hypothetical protein